MMKICMTETTYLFAAVRPTTMKEYTSHYNRSRVPAIASLFKSMHPSASKGTAIVSLISTFGHHHYGKTAIRSAFGVHGCALRRHSKWAVTSTSPSAGGGAESTLHQRTPPTWSSLASASSSPYEEDYFLKQVEGTVSNVLRKYGADVDVLDLPAGPEREALQIARRLHKGLASRRSGQDCPRCWLRREHCICARCPPIQDHGEGGGLDRLKRIFVVMHHKEVGLKVDTAKLILSTFPNKARLVVGGIGAEYQPSMKEMLEAITGSNNTRRTLLLFPDESSRTLKDVIYDTKRAGTDPPQLRADGQHRHRAGVDRHDDGYDLIVLDGTWSQARKFHSRYFSASGYGDDDAAGAGDRKAGTLSPSPGPKFSLHRVHLSEEAVRALGDGSVGRGHQLRKHSIAWRQVGTFEATRLFLRDWCQVFGGNGEAPAAEEEGGGVGEPSSPSSFRRNDANVPCWERMEPYQRIANEAARKESSLPLGTSFGIDG
jgi:DTW domain-containing protein YfiP